MKALFLINNIPAMEMFAPIIRLLDGYECVFVNYDGWTERNKARIAGYAQGLGIRCRLLQEHTEKGVRDIFDSEHPDIVVFSHEETTIAGTLFLIYAEVMKIPTLLVPHGMISDKADRQIWGADRKFARLFKYYLLARQAFIKVKMGRIYFLRLLKTGYYRIRNDFSNKVSLSRWDRYSMIAAYGESMRDILVGYGVVPSGIEITGNPKFDAVYHKRGSVHKKTVLLITDYMVEFGLWSAKQRRDFVLDICHAVESLPEYRLVIKIHPVVEGRKDYDFIVSGMVKPPMVCQHEPIADLIGECDLAITVLSSAGLEAMVAMKPLVVYNPYHSVTHYKATDGVHMVYDGDGLSAILRELVINGESEQQKRLAGDFVYKQAYIQDGKASERIVALINKMMEGKVCNVVKDA